MTPVKIFLLSAMLLFLGSCSESGSEQAIASEGSVPALAMDEHAVDAEVPGQSEAEPEPVTDDSGQVQTPRIVAQKWMGDLDVMEERRVIRVLTVYGVGRYFLDGPRERGITSDLLKMFEDFLNQRMNKGHLRVHVIFIPVARDELIPGLLSGRGDLAVAGLTITARRDEQIDFSQPVSKAVSEILITGPAAPPLASIEDLSGQTVHVRNSSSYRASLERLNRRFSEEGKAPVNIEPISEMLEDDDLLEMVNAGLLPWAIVDDYKANIWAGVFENLKVRNDIVFREGGRIGWAFRENSPLLEAAVNDFLKSHRQGTMLGNILVNRYLKDFDYAANALDSADYERFLAVKDIFQSYGEQYGFDFLIVAAQGYQESRLDQSVRSHRGAVGIMQLLPSTAADPNVGIPDIEDAEANIHAGVKYMDFIRKRYFNDPEIDHQNQVFFSLAAYNAGPARVRKLRAKAEQQGYDPNRWFDNVEVIAAKDIGRETVQYVANIYKYFIAYSLSVQQMVMRYEEREKAGVN